MAAAKKRGAPAPRPRSGWVSEDDRNTTRLTLRLDPEAMELLNVYADSLGWTKAHVVEMALEAFKNDKMTLVYMAEAKAKKGPSDE